MNHTAHSGLEALLQRPAAATLAPALRAALLQAWQDQPEPPRLPWPVLADTLDALALLSADEAALLAALLFDLPGLRAQLPQLPVEPPARAQAVTGLLDAQDAADQVWALHAGREAGRNSEGLRRLLLSIVQDLRVVPILLARQLAQMRVADKAPEAQRRALAQLTRDIHAPLANRLGIWQLKWELEDLAFRHLEPDTYRRIAREVDESRVARERYIEAVKKILSKALAEQGLRAEISGRPKHIYSIWRKMQKKRLAFDQLYDLRAVRVMVDDVAACYAALGVVHALWAPVPSEFDDYIARPKANDYRSLHTAVVGPEGRTIEVQIRTHDMHAQAELGVAAHWKYKEGGKGAEKAFDRKITWMRQLLEQSQDGEQGGLAGALDAELVEDRVYALTPMGEVIDLPQGATPLDFAYHVHTMVGHRCRGAKVNNRIVPLTHKLRSGDRVEILTGKEAEPRRDWLLPANGYLASGRSRDKVRAWFHKLDRARNVQAGKELLERELKRLGLQQADLLPAAKKFHADGVEELYIQVALGDVGPSQVGRALHEAERAAAQPAVPAMPRPTARRTGLGKSKFTVQGVGNLLVQLARCCQPVAGEPIAGYLTRTRGVTVHRSDCAAFARLAAGNPQRVLPVEWGQAGGGYEVDVLVRAVDRRWLLKDITNLIAQEEAHVLEINSDNVRDSGLAQLRLRLKVGDYGQLSTLLGKLDALPGVHEARRLG
ncbi:bifunctional (p)ppGpp synthetase/guanosine-3',5'-bis(diphosphate) 3'-pyrophosphohydrolase [Xanthomonas rydalmerensis]|uniref:GTP pyrophosphokinase n=1 Tax=Xanthomonas rydalmerensis TaxID=3046274 RepID=A0ABZ0JQD5_9XANT|nr:bifunctional (p)ppGpp synthetase/guanosine-3',5'-bis(diphosphate) 3'-pyrophosphohydrolase [Xanthomonas sp. DM-2023]WOS42021.1 bifunctional (p)ppGpp synthetase/guanosine-3',5'-bis(diphosphate) 3'-pyrophosphohydrolase [Xanthomonas sp. DM-2023]WOS46206.1 bifunctional (p)ppGpp synthetase/guanosine-3',5'-bis(diphosphate) 3'-pyrophosphohydrolase [Xanthomonas sp. DM-2023]WOS50385.1 bifunctional (p)ppGpp synthetase/guanosine-3',5'-bis(diphosphate) 3'-pyrophosphohydrolase [Xanthomonas sp. DM-2023]WOS